MGFFNFFKRDISEEEFQEQQKVKRGLEKTRTGFFQSIVNTLTNAQIDDASVSKRRVRSTRVFSVLRVSSSWLLIARSVSSRMVAQAASPSARMDSRNRSARVSNSFMVTPLKS